jgi:adenylosuccinate lyase
LPSQRESLAFPSPSGARLIAFVGIRLYSRVLSVRYKMAGDIRLLAHMKEIEEPFGKSQIGSSAMAYKRNPMRCERVCSLARYVMSLPENAAATAANQWFERTLDDSANRRIVLPEAFLSVDVVLGLCSDVAAGMQVWPAVIAAHLRAELPFMTTEVILMQCVKAGGDRQALHEAIREHSMAAGAVVKRDGQPNDLLERISRDPLFAPVHGSLESLVDPSLFVGRCPQQVDDFLASDVAPLLARHASALAAEDVDKINV